MNGNVGYEIVSQAPNIKAANVMNPESCCKEKPGVNRLLNRQDVHLNLVAKSRDL